MFFGSSSLTQVSVIDHMAVISETERKFEGFADLQVNGFAGVDFNNPGLTVENFIRVSRALLGTGVTTFCPTVITSSKENLIKIFATLAQAVEQDLIVKRMIPCFHLEGPYISGENEYRGAHSKEYIRDPSIKEFKELQAAAGGRIGLVTLAPEREGAIEFIRYLVDKKIKVAIGHTAASEEQIKEAVKAGATLSTHLGNGIASTLKRNDNPIIHQQACDGLAATFIADGNHLPPDALKVYFRAKEPRRSILVTDAMAAAGAPPGTYTLGELELVVGEDKVVHLPGKTLFAGSALTMPEAVGNAVRWGDVIFEEAMRMASGNPREYLGIAAPEGFIVFYTWDENEYRLTVRRTEVRIGEGAQTFNFEGPIDARR